VISRQVGIGDVERDIDAIELGMRLQLRRRKHHATAVRLERMRQRWIRKQAALLDVVGSQRGERLPRRTLREPRGRPDGDRLSAARHAHGRIDLAGQIVARGQ
jgi:hypothetical protein